MEDGKGNSYNQTHGGDIFGDREALEQLEASTRYFRAELELLGELNARFTGGTQLFRNVVRLMIAMVRSDCKAFDMLSSCGFVRAAYIVSRSVLEMMVNVCFVIVGGEEVATRALRHADQKAFRDLDRELSIGEEIIKLQWSGRDNIDLSESLKSSLEEFTTASGKEERRWTPESIQQRIENVADICGSGYVTGLMYALFSVYRHSSEILHGTFFGAIYCTGATLPGGFERSEKELKEHVQESLAMLNYMNAACIRDLLMVMAKTFEDDNLTALVEKSDRNLKTFSGMGDSDPKEFLRSKGIGT